MTREAFIKELNRKKYPYRIKGDNVVVTYRGYVDLESLTSLPPGVEFKNGGRVYLGSLTSLPSGVEFRNDGDVYLDSITSISPGVVFNNRGDVGLRSLIGGWIDDWSGNIEGIDSNRLLNKMIELGLFNR